MLRYVLIAIDFRASCYSLYREAAGLVRKVRGLMKATDRAADFAPYLQSLRTAQRRKRNLMAMLDG